MTHDDDLLLLILFCKAIFVFPHSLSLTLNVYYINNLIVLEEIRCDAEEETMSIFKINQPAEAEVAERANINYLLCKSFLIYAFGFMNF